MAGDSIKSLGNVVPEVYFDLIARVPPGAFVVVCLWALYRWKTGSKIIFLEFNAGTATVALILLLGASYSVGLLLGPAGRLLTERFARHHWNKQCARWGISKLLVQEFLIPGSCNDETDAHITAQQNRELIYRRLQDYLKGVDPQARTLLPKINAEKSFCANAAAAIMLVSLATVGVMGKAVDGTLLLWLLAGVAFCVWGSWERTRMLIVRHFSYFELRAVMGSNPSKSEQSVALGRTREVGVTAAK